MPINDRSSYVASWRSLALALVVLTLAGCAKKDERRLLAEDARSAVLDLLANPKSATFLEERTIIDVDRGLVCGQVSAEDDSGEVGMPQRYYFVRSIGAAIDSDRLDIIFDDPSNQVGGDKMPQDNLSRLRSLCERSGESTPSGTPSMIK